MRWWWLPIALLALLVGLLAELWQGEGGRRELAALQQRVAAQQAENDQLSARNAAFAAELQDLKTGEAAVEERARSELGMIKPGETFYRVVEPPNNAVATPPPSP